MGDNIRGRRETVDETYEHKVNRDKRAKELQALGFIVRRTSMRNQNMHPAYLKDYTGEGKDNNFGNGYYRTFFSVIYIVKAEKPIRLFGYDQ